jgi:hypothetical protein
VMNTEDRIRELAHLLGAIRACLQQGGSYLVSRCAPNGPIMRHICRREPNLSYLHKAIWGMYAAGVEHDLIARLLDWAMKHALQPNGDFYIPGEGPEYKDSQRAYRPLTFGKVAAWIGHPLARDERIINRLLQYQHRSGGAFNYIGEDPAKVEEQPTIGSLNTTFFGHLMIALGRKEEAIRAGDWCCRFVQANEEYMARDGVLYSNMTPDGRLLTDVKPGGRISGLVDNRAPKQEFWQIGTTMAYLCTLYDALRAQWGYSAEQARPYLDNAFSLLDFEATMPLDTYLWPSKCKVGWGAGELLRVLVKYDLGTEAQREGAYQAARKTAIFTFMDNQLPNGGWSCMHYPLSELIPEMALDYKPLKGLVNVPDQRIPGSNTIFLPSEEISGEFLGEMKVVEQGVAAWRQALGK